MGVFTLQVNTSVFVGMQVYKNTQGIMQELLHLLYMEVDHSLT